MHGATIRPTAALRLGIEAFYSAYSIQVAEETYSNSFSR